MHHNYFILKQVAAQLQRVLPGMHLDSCFSNSREDLYFEFTSENAAHYLHIKSVAEQLLFTFPESPVNKSRLFIPWFKELQGQRIARVEAVPYDRFVVIHFESGQTLVFKLFGRFSNIIQLENNKVLSLFRKHIEADVNFDTAVLQSAKSFQFDAAACQLPEFFKAAYPFVPAEGITYLQSTGFFDAPAEQEQRFTAFKQMLEAPKSYYCMVSEDKVKLTLFKPEHSYTEYQQVTEALNAFVPAYIRLHTYKQSRQQLEASGRAAIKKKEQFLAITRQSLSELENKTSFEHLANILMANLHAIPEGAKSAELLNFYTDEVITIKLNPDLTPQKQAENYYRKAKNRHIEVQHLETRITEAEKQLQILQEKLSVILTSQSAADLKPFSKQQKKAGAEIELPYKELEIQSFKIWLGKHAKSNDALLRDAKKEDIWMHVKDHAGSHVLIRRQNNKPVPESVLKRAASIAAYHSKARNHSLVPVMYTERKYVRKPKGAMPGEVLVEKEKVLLVSPENY